MGTSSTEFLEALSGTWEPLNELARQVRAHPEVKSVRVYPFNASFLTAHQWDDFGVSAELFGGAVVDWWIEVRRGKAAWQIAASVLRSDAGEDGSHRVLELGKREAFSAVTLSAQLLDVVRSLAASAGAQSLPQ